MADAEAVTGSCRPEISGVMPRRCSHCGIAGELVSEVLYVEKRLDRYAGDWSRWCCRSRSVCRNAGEASVELLEIGLGGVVSRKASGDSLELGLGTGGILFSGVAPPLQTTGNKEFADMQIT